MRMQRRRLAGLGLVLIVGAVVTAARAGAAEPWTQVARWKVDVPKEDLLWSKVFGPAVALSPKADLVAYAAPGSPDLTLVDARDGKVARILKGHEPRKGDVPGDVAGSIGRIAFSPDGRWVLGLQSFSPRDDSSNYYDKLGCVNLWRVDGSAHHVLPIGDDPQSPAYGTPHDIAFSPRGSSFAIATVNRLLLGDVESPDRLRPLALGALVRGTPTSEGYFPVRLVFSPDGSHLAAGFNRLARDTVARKFTPRPSRLAIWKLAEPDGVPRLGSSPLLDHQVFWRVDELAFSPDGRTLLVAGPGAWLWDWSAGKTTVLNLPKPFDATYAVGFRRDGRQVILAGLGTPPFRLARVKSDWPRPLPEPLEKPAFEARLVTYDLASGQSTTALRPGTRAAAWNAAESTMMALATRAGVITLEREAEPSKP